MRRTDPLRSISTDLAIDAVIAAKTQGAKLDYQAISDFVSAEMSRLESKVAKRTTSSPVKVDLSDLFREILDEA